MKKHVNGRDVSESINLQMSSHPSATNEELKDYLKSIRHEMLKLIVIHTRKPIHRTI